MTYPIIKDSLILESNFSIGRITDKGIDVILGWKPQTTQMIENVPSIKLEIMTFLEKQFFQEIEKLLTSDLEQLDSVLYQHRKDFPEDLKKRIKAYRSFIHDSDIG
jgi:hypothetical protein